MPQVELLQQSKIYSVSSGDIEYTIYAYDYFEEEKIGHNRWRRMDSINNEAQAIMRAKDLFDTRRYQKIEIQKKIFNEKKGRNVVKTFRVYESGKKNNYFIGGAILLTAIIAAISVYLNY